MALESRVTKIEDHLHPPAACRATVWFDACEPQKAAIARLGKVGPDDVVILLANWAPCPASAGIGMMTPR